MYEIATLPEAKKPRKMFPQTMAPTKLKEIPMKRIKPPQKPINMPQIKAFLLPMKSERRGIRNTPVHVPKKTEV